MHIFIDINTEYSNVNLCCWLLKHSDLEGSCLVKLFYARHDLFAFQLSHATSSSINN